jgi:hypothetical protein
VTAAGFTLDATSDLLRNPSDTRDWNSSPKAATEAGKRGTSDRFMLRFVKGLPPPPASNTGSASAGSESAAGSASSSGSALGSSSTAGSASGSEAGSGSAAR